MDWRALVAPPLIWAKAVWILLFLKTYRHRISGMLPIVAGGLMFAALRLDEPRFPILLGAAASAIAAMFAAPFWPPRIAGPKRTVR